jgi:hypothetical protein
MKTNMESSKNLGTIVIASSINKPWIFFRIFPRSFLGITTSASDLVMANERQCSEPFENVQFGHEHNILGNTSFSILTMFREVYRRQLNSRNSRNNCGIPTDYTSESGYCSDYRNISSMPRPKNHGHKNVLEDTNAWNQKEKNSKE